MDRKKICLVIAALSAAIIGTIPHHNYMWFSNHFCMYPGDIWYVFDHYVSKGWFFPVEYPSLMRVFVQLVNTVTTRHYTDYLWTTVYFFLPFIAGTTMMLSEIQRQQGSSEKNLWIFWVLAPSFIVCSTTNYDHIALFTLMLGLYLGWKGRPVIGAASIAVGAAFKVFPFFFLPLLFLLRKDGLSTIRMMASFAGTWLFLNLPYMLFDGEGFKGWLYPYVWQASQNFSRGPGDGSLWWVLFQLTGRYSGMISLILTFSCLTWLVIRASKDENYNENIWQWARGVALIYIFFDRVYSPQYNLYLLPFLALSKNRINLFFFYLLELPNICQLLFLFYVRTHHYIMVPLISLKYIALIAMLSHFIHTVALKPPAQADGPQAGEDRTPDTQMPEASPGLQTPGQ